MALVALEFEDNTVYVAAAKTAGKRIEINHLFSVDISGADSEAAEELKGALGKNGCARADAIIVVSRANAEMREIEVPPAPTNELPDMVRFIARNEFASMNDNWAFDFVPLSDDETKMRKVIAAGVSPEMKNQVTSIAESAGLKIKHMVLRPYSAAGLIRDRVADERCRLVMDPSGDTTDLMIMEGPALLATRTVRVPASYTGEKRIKALMGEAKRTLASSRKLLHGKEFSQVLIFSDNDEGDALKREFEELKYMVEVLNPTNLAPVSSRIDRPKNAARYTGLLGALTQHHEKDGHLIDFVNPRRPIVKTRDMSKVYLYGGLGVAVLLFAIGFGWWTLRSQANEIAQLQDDFDNVKEQNAGTENRPGVDEILGRVGVVDDWVKTDINWLEELYQYSDRALTPDDTIVDSFDAEINRRTEDAPRISVNAKVGGVLAEEELLESLGARPFEVSTTRGAENDDESYPFSASLKINLIKKGDEVIDVLDEKADAFFKARNERMDKEAAEKAKSQVATETTDADEATSPE